MINVLLKILYGTFKPSQPEWISFTLKAALSNFTVTPLCSYTELMVTVQFGVDEKQRNITKLVGIKRFCYKRSSSYSSEE